MNTSQDTEGDMSVSKEMKEAVILAANSCCHFCSRLATTVDHKISLAAGGKNARDNLLAACEPCNVAKGTMPYDLFFRYTRRFGRPECARYWRQNTNWYADGAIAKILNNVDLKRAVKLVLEKFSDGDLRVALTKIRRASTAHKSKIDIDELGAICQGMSPEMPSNAR